MINCVDIFAELSDVKSIMKQNLPYEVLGFGKMIRSKIGLLFIKLVNEKPEKYLSFLSAIELIHTASLLHDDVIDDDNLRRNKENIKFVYGDKISVLYGDLIISNALKLISSYNSSELTVLFCETLNSMCRGEILQNSQISVIPAIEEYINKTELKTASLFKFIFDGINLLSGKKLCLPTDFGTNFGIAFQIKNDLDNVLSDNSDIKNGIYTAPVIFSGGADITKTGIEKTRCLIDNYRSKCLQILSKFENSIFKEELIGVVECLIS